ncbi:11020_t:CDS:2 [Paraglomus occultum]|uniref:3'-5' exonuclease n=1 Tax=Paraglomus occultum TaxID=144539 RepID=A0A9N9FZK7_9GLOM|nr:11020_t:CDS:2 [Paraglomus occultum]
MTYSFPVLFADSSKKISSIVQELDKAKIPKFQTEPPVYQIATRSSVAACFGVLQRNSTWPVAYVGFDTETTVKRLVHPRVVSMIQIATAEFCLLFQVYRITRGDATIFPTGLQKLLNDPNILKVGVNARGDAKWLKESYGIEMNGIVDLDRMAKEKGIHAKSLAELALMFTDNGLELNKTDKIIDWDFDAVCLDDEIVQYVACDAFVALRIYENMLVDKRNPNYKSWEERYPMTLEEEESELYTIFKRHNMKGTVTKIGKLVNSGQSSYSRWQKTKPETLERRQAIGTAIKHFLSDGRLILAKNDEPGDSAGPGSDSAGPGGDPVDLGDSADFIDTLDEKDFLQLRVKFPGVALSTILELPEAEGFLTEKGFDEKAVYFIKWLSPHLHKTLRKKMMINLCKTTRLMEFDLDEEQCKLYVTDMIQKMVEFDAFKSFSDNHTFEFNPVWVEELERIYEKCVK